MKKLICLLLTFVLVLGMTACSHAPYRFLEDAIEKKGEEKNGVVALKLSEESYVYNKDGTLIFFRTVKGTTIVTVNLYMDAASVRDGKYYWDGIVNYRDETYLIKDCVLNAADVHKDDVTIPIGKIYTLPEGNIMIERHVKSSVSREVLALMADLADYLEKNGAKYTLKDLGFDVFFEKASAES